MTFESVLASLVATLPITEHAPGQTLIRQGEPGASFLVILDGTVAISRADDAGEHDLGSAARGSILGELSMLTGWPRRATVTTITPTRVATGGREAFEHLLDQPELHERLTDAVAGRLAENVRPVPITLRDGESVALRPLLPRDREALAAEIAALSPESRRRRFFTGGQPSARVIDYLVNIDYVDHFAWVMMTPDGGRGVATARYIRLADDPEQAELAFGVAEDHQGKGIASQLLGALAAAASSAGITRFVAETLNDNAPMRAVLTKAGAKWDFQEPGILSTTFAVSGAQPLVDDDLRSALVAQVRDVVTASGLALARAADPLPAPPHRG